jgi:hypothetical protein
MRDSSGMQGVAPAEQHANNLFHQGLAAFGRQRQDLQVFLCTALGPVFFPQRVVREPEPTRGKQIFAIAIVFKRVPLRSPAEALVG